MLRISKKLVAGLSCLLSCLTFTMAKADIFTNYSDFFNWNYAVTHMADIDQRRAYNSIAQRNGLPGDGHTYCVPTACYNLLQYAHAHGYPLIEAVDDFNCIPTTDYNQATQDLGLIGLLMGTDPNSGTGGAGAYGGMQLLLPGANATYFGQFNILQTYSYNGLPITLDWIGMLAMQGGIGNIGVGWYQWDPFFSMMLRHGGHFMTLAALQKSSNLANPLITLHDPNTDPNTESLFYQSQVSHDSYEVVSTPYIYGSTEGQFTVFGSLPYIQGEGGAIDNCLFVVPAFGFTSDPANIQLSEYHPYQLTATELPKTKSFTAQGTQKLISVALDPVRSSRYYIKQRENWVWELDRLSGLSSVFAEVANPRQVIVGGRLLTRYVLTTKAIVSYDSNRIPHSQATLSSPLDQIVFDPTHNRVLGISRRRKLLYAYDADSLRLENIYALPAVQFPTGDLSLSVNPATGVLLLHCDNSDMVWQVAMSHRGNVRVTRVQLQEAGVHAVGLNVDEVGRLYASVNGKIQAYTPTGKIFSSSLFNGLASGRFLEISRSFSNFDPNIHTGPAYRDIPPTGR